MRCSDSEGVKCPTNQNRTAASHGRTVLRKKDVNGIEGVLRRGGVSYIAIDRKLDIEREAKEVERGSSLRYFTGLLLFGIPPVAF